MFSTVEAPIPQATHYLIFFNIFVSEFITLIILIRLGSTTYTHLFNTSTTCQPASGLICNLFSNLVPCFVFESTLHSLPVYLVVWPIWGLMWYIFKYCLFQYICIKSLLCEQPGLWFSNKYHKSRPFVSCKTEIIDFPCILELKPQNTKDANDAQQCFPKCVLWNTSPVGFTIKKKPNKFKKNSNPYSWRVTVQIK